jgi:hypothetical protein
MKHDQLQEDMLQVEHHDEQDRLLGRQDRMNDHRIGCISRIGCSQTANDRAVFFARSEGYKSTGKYFFLFKNIFTSSNWNVQLPN